MLRETHSLYAVNLQKSYQNKTVSCLQYFGINAGEIVGIFGPNGAGKTTAFYMLVGLIASDSGRIVLDDQDITSFPMHIRARLGIGYLPQESCVFRDMTVEDNIMMALEFMRYTKKDRIKKLEDLLKDFSIEHIAKRKTALLSGGERRRAEIARLLATCPRFVFLDEPFAGVDPVAIKDIKALIQAIQKRGVGVVITDHNIRDVLPMVNRAIIMFEGNVFLEGLPENIVQHEHIRKMYLGDYFD